MFSIPISFYPGHISFQIRHYCLGLQPGALPPPLLALDMACSFFCCFSYAPWFHFPLLAFACMLKLKMKRLWKNTFSISENSSCVEEGFSEMQSKFKCIFYWVQLLVNIGKYHPFIKETMRKCRACLQSLIIVQRQLLLCLLGLWLSH